MARLVEEDGGVMKTGMEYPLLGLVVLLALVGLWNAWTGMQVEIASASLEAMAAGESAPAAPALLAGEWAVKAIVGALVGGTVTAIVTAFIWWARRRWNKSQAGGGWKTGPNANWVRQERGPRGPSESELYRMMLMQQMAQNGGGRLVSPPRVEDVDDEPTIRI